MSNLENKRTVPIYFYYLSISKQKSSDDQTSYDMTQIVSSFTKLLSYITKKDLVARSQKFSNAEKVVWLDSYEDMKDGNYNLIFKSAKYNHVRNEIDTETMQELGTRKRQQDGEEEKTHLCIRLAKGQHRFLAVHESNHYGISIGCINQYLNAQFEAYNEDTDDKYHYSISYEIMPGDDFIHTIKKARTIRSLKLVVSKTDIPNDFMDFADRDEISDEVEIVIKRPKGSKKLPENLINAYYNDMQSNNKIKRIIAVGTNKLGGPMDVDTDLIKMKHYISVNTVALTNEVESVDFFDKAQEFINETRKSI